MKNIYFSIPFIFVIGCSATTITKPEIKSADIVKEKEVVTIKEKSIDSDSEKVCETVIDSVKWSYNKSKDVWERVTSEENKSKLSKTWDKTKKATKDAWEAGKKAYDEK